MTDTTNEEVREIDFEDPSEKQPNFPPNFSEGCWLRYQKFMNNPDIPQGKVAAMLCLVVSTYFLGLAMTMGKLTESGIGGGTAFKVYHRPKNLIAVIALIFFGYLVIEYGATAIPYLQYKNIQDSVNSGDEPSIPMGAAGEESIGALQLCIEKDPGNSRFSVSNNLTTAMFFIFAVIWTTLYTVWILKMIVFANPQLATGLGGSARQWVQEEISKLQNEASKASAADQSAFGRRRKRRY